MKRFTQTHLDEFCKLGQRRVPRKRTPRPEIPQNLAPVWQTILEAAAEYPYLAPALKESMLVSIQPQTRTASITTKTTGAAAMLMKNNNRYWIQRKLGAIFRRPLKICISYSEQTTVSC